MGLQRDWNIDAKLSDQSDKHCRHQRFAQGVGDRLGQNYTKIVHLLDGERKKKFLVPTQFVTLGVATDWLVDPNTTTTIIFPKCAFDVASNWHLMVHQMQVVGGVFSVFCCLQGAN